MSRIKVLRVLMVVAFAAIALRLFAIQIIEHDAWVAKAAEAHTAEKTIAARRGMIYMMDGTEAVPVVMNNTVYTVIVDPMAVDEEEVKAKIDELAKDYEVARWEDVFRNRALRYYEVAKNVPFGVAEKIKEARLAGVWFKQNSARVYPEGQMAAQLLGFVNVDGEGQYGVEGAFDERLTGQDGMMKSVVDVNNVALSIGDENIKVPAVDGENILLTIDRNVQTKVEQILSAAAEKAGAGVRAAAVVMNPQNGEIMAMASVPTYDPANYAMVESGESYTNYATEVAYETASVCKSFAFAAAMDLGVMTPETTYNNTGSVVVDGFRIYNAYTGQLGTVTMQTGLNYSLNTSSVYALTLMGGTPGVINQQGRERLYDYYHNHFNLGDYTGIELAESTGILREPNDGYAMNLTYANMTFGQGLNVTMTQVTAAISALVNGGVYHTPTVVKGTVNDAGEIIAVDTRSERNAKEGTQVISETTSQRMREMFYSGRGLLRLTGVDPAGYYVGGKTGTGQRIMEDGSYSDVESGDTIASYVGFGGANGQSPAYVVMTKIWGDGRRFGGEYDARPIFNDISNYLIDYLQIKPN